MKSTQSEKRAALEAYAARKASLKCPFELDVIEPCTSCSGAEAELNHVRECAKFGRTTRGANNGSIASCLGCEHNPVKEPEAKIGVPCATCGKRKVKCRACAGADYAPHIVERVETPKVLVPQPPTLRLERRSLLALVTLVIGDEARACFAASRPGMVQYAERLGADLVILDEDFYVGNPAWPMSAKFGVGRVLDLYPRIVYADADVLFRPGCVDVLTAAGNADWAGCDERAHQMQSEIGRRFLASYGREPPFYFNCGVQVVKRRAQQLLLPPLSPMPAHHCAEQDYVNTGVRREYLAGRLNIRLLDRRCNWQNWTDYGFREAPPDAVLHWSGAGSMRNGRAADMLRVANMEVT